MTPTQSPESPTTSHPVRFLTSPLLEAAGLVHAFFTRHGGVSEGAFSSLNFSSKSGDTPGNVTRNLALAAGDLGVSSLHVYFASQVHGVDVVEVAEGDDRQRVLRQQADIVVTRAASHAAAIRTADCVPILLACPQTGWVGACHAGWRGCVAGAAQHAVRALRSRGAERVLAAVGPHISLRAFEVSADVAQQLAAASPDPDVIDHTHAKPHVDLRKLVESQLRAAGVLLSDIDHVAGCTHDEPERFYSFRRDGDPSGRLLSAIVAPPQGSVAHRR